MQQLTKQIPGLDRMCSVIEKTCNKQVNKQYLHNVICQEENKQDSAIQKNSRIDSGKFDIWELKRCEEGKPSGIYTHIPCSNDSFGT